MSELLFALVIIVLLLATLAGSSVRVLREYERARRVPARPPHRPARARA